MASVERVAFTDADVMPVVQAVAGGADWVNLDPDVDDDDLPPPRGALGALFSGRGRDIPRATWVGATPKDSASVGVEHGAGRRVRDVMGELGLALPSAWTIIQDHPRRGFVAAVPQDDLVTTFEWLLAAATALSSVPLTGRWQAEVHRR